MSCPDMTDLLVAHSGGELAPAQQEFVEMHLDHCPDCRTALQNLEQTRRQLEGLRAENYQPALTAPIMLAIRRRRVMTTLFRIAQAGVAAAILVAVFRIAWPYLQPTPAGPPPGTATHLVVGGALLRVDTGTFTHQRVGVRTQQVLSGGGSLFTVAGGQLLVISPNGGQSRRLATIGGNLLLGVAPDGRTVWVGRQVSASEFTVDAVDVRSGQYSPGSARQAGRVQSAAVARNGSQLFLVARSDEAVYLKAVDTVRRQLQAAYVLGAFPADATPLASRDGKQVFLVGTGRAAVITPGDPEATRFIPGEHLTNRAVLVPGGQSLLVAHAQGGLLELNPSSGSLTRLSTGSVYTALDWSDDGQWLFAVDGRRLDVFAAGQYLRPARRIEIGD